MYWTRLKLFLWVVALAMVVLAVRLAHLQVAGAGSYRKEAEANLVRGPVLLETRRGSVRDRNGLVLAEDTARFDVCMYYPFMAVEDEALVRRVAARHRLPIREVRRKMAPLWFDSDRFVETQADSRDTVPERIEQMLSDFWPRLAKETGIDIALLDERRQAILQKVHTIREAVRRRHGRVMPIREEAKGPRGIAHPIIVDIDELTKAVIAVLQTEYDWLIVEQHAKRVYRYNQCAAHVVGRVVEVDESTLGTSPDGPGSPLADDRQRVYRLHDLKGVLGIESSMERFLRGRRGIEQRDKAGKLLLHEPSRPGQDVSLTLDVLFQDKIEAFMSRPPTPLAHRGRIRGAAVVIDIRTGGLLALVSLPRFNPNTFADDWKDLREGVGNPLLHRAVAGQLAQGSIFKAVTATAALHESRITTQTTFVCNKYLEPHRTDRFKCHIGGPHGPISLHRALVKSCNIYFYNAGMSIGTAKLTEWGRRFGFATLTGLLLPGEQPGLLPEGEDPRNLAIGQGRLMVTPLQSARFMALIAAGGRMTEVHVVASPRPKGKPLVEIDMKLDPRYTAIVRQGLTGVVNEQGGTGYKYMRSDLVRIAGKTGSAQSGRRDRTHAWFVGFAPAEDPQIALSVVFEHGGAAGAVAGPVARQIVEAALRLGIITTRTASSR